MKDEEIKALMNKYTEAISFNTLEGIHSPEDNEKFQSYENMEMADYVALKRKEAHKIAIEVIGSDSHARAQSVREELVP